MGNTKLPTLKTLFWSSIDIIKNHQSPNGAFVASPNFVQYQYCWLRDGSYIAYAMDCVGEFQSSRIFHEWIDAVIKRYADKIIRIEQLLANGIQPKDSEFLHTRYFVSGEEDLENQGWGNFQIDGYGTWLWALAKHIEITKDEAFLKQMVESIRLTCRYLYAAYSLPCYDLWEENPHYLHTYSLSAVYGGLKAISRLMRAYKYDVNSPLLDHTMDTIRQWILGFGVKNAHLVKHIQRGSDPVYNNLVDASLIAVCTPYNVLPQSYEIMTNTVGVIEDQLVRDSGGVYRYTQDTYYGGGEWILLAGWLGWQYVQEGKISAATRLLEWIEGQADEKNQLPEQVSKHMLFPAFYDQWVEEWGLVAKPLLWSHAMYLILFSSLQKYQGKT